MDGPITARDTWLRFAAEASLPIAHEAERVADLFGPEMARYCELVRSPGRGPMGLMVRGDDATFTERALSVMRTWEMPPDAIDHYCRLAERFAHKRSFLKLEWSPAPDGGVARLAAYYFRRRPSVEEMLRHFWLLGVGTAPLDRVVRLAAVLDKHSIHFVSGAMRPCHTLEHKLYFSQYALPDRRDLLARRLEDALRLSGIDDVAIAQLLRCHARLLAKDREDTFFVSMRFGAGAVPAYLKIDYPRVPAPALLECVPEPERLAAQSEVLRLCAAAGIGELSFVGVTVRAGAPLQLKYYADLPGGPPSPQSAALEE